MTVTYSKLQLESHSTFIFVGHPVYIIITYLYYCSSEGRSDKENKLVDTSLSLSRSISHSSDRDDPDSHVKDTLQVFRAALMISSKSLSFVKIKWKLEEVTKSKMDP